MNQVWSYDFVFDACANDQQIKCFTVVDEYARERLAIDVAGSIRSRRVIDVLSKLIEWAQQLKKFINRGHFPNDGVVKN